MDRRTFLTTAAALLAGCGGGGSSVAPEPAKSVSSAQTLLPDHPALSYTDCAAVEMQPGVARFLRPIVNGFGYEFSSPGSRVRFWTDSETVTVRVRDSGLMTRTDTRQSVGAVIVDGALAATWSDVERITVKHVGRRMRLHEIVWPYSASIDFLGVEIEPGATAAAASRTGRRIALIGDSITHGFWASDVAHTWSFLLAQATGLEVVNLGVGGRMCVPSDGTDAAACLPDVVAYMIGYNEFSQQADPAEFGARYAQTLANIRAGRPGARVLAITPIWSPNSKPIPLEAYRQAIRDSVPADPLVTLVDGLSIMPCNDSSLTDTVHPSDAGAAAIAASLAALI